MRQIVRIESGFNVEPYVCHVFSKKKGQNSNEYTTAAVTYLQHYHFRTLSTDPMEGTDAVALKTSSERIRVSLNESNEEHGWWDLAHELMLIQGFENRKYVVNGLPSYAYTALHNWCCLHMITNSTSGVFCVLCSRQINSKMTGPSMTLFNSVKKSQVIDHLIGRFHCNAVSRIRGENALCDLLSL